jgi:hypothetical protein
MPPEPRVLLIRHHDDQLILINVPGAIPWPTALAQRVEFTLDTLGAPRPRTADTAQEADDG